jgi:hypothetical protein
MFPNRTILPQLLISRRMYASSRNANLSTPEGNKSTCKIHESVQPISTQVRRELASLLHQLDGSSHQYVGLSLISGLRSNHLGLRSHLIPQNYIKQSNELVIERRNVACDMDKSKTLMKSTMEIAN